MNSSILIVGGRSRVALALRRLRPGFYDYVVRSQSAAGDGSEELVVDSYGDLTAADMKGYSTVINLVGTAQGTANKMMEVNAVLARQLAREAVRAGVGHFIALSSFSVYGSTKLIRHETSLAPVSAYGHSRVAGEAGLAELAKDGPAGMACTIARCPMLYGAGDSKLERLVKLWIEIGHLPVPPTPVHRSMAHYDLAARYLDERAKSGPVQPGVTIEHFADPVTFEYRRAAHILSLSTGRARRCWTLPSALLRLFGVLLPRMAQSLYQNSVLEREANYFKQHCDSRLERDLAEMASGMLTSVRGRA